MGRSAPGSESPSPPISSRGAVIIQGIPGDAHGGDLGVRRDGGAQPDAAMADLGPPDRPFPGRTERSPGGRADSDDAGAPFRGAAT